MVDQKKDIRLLCVDVDGTLAASDKKISQANIEALKKVHDQGIEVVIASGRGPDTLYEILKSANLPLRVICYNGACVEIDGNEIAGHYLDQQYVRLAVEILQQEKVQSMYNRRDLSIRSHDIPQKWKEVVASGGVISKYLYLSNKQELYEKVIDPKYPLYKISVYEEKDETFSKLRKTFEDLGVFEVTTSDQQYLDLCPPKVTKGSGLLELCAFLNIDPSQTMVIGDNENDIPMFEKAGFSIAMKNADPFVKSYADIVSRQDNDHSGVAVEITAYLLDKK